MASMDTLIELRRLGRCQRRRNLFLHWLHAFLLLISSGYVRPFICVVWIPRLDAKLHGWLQ